MARVKDNPDQVRYYRGTAPGKGWEKLTSFSVGAIAWRLYRRKKLRKDQPSREFRLAARGRAPHKANYGLLWHPAAGELQYTKDLEVLREHRAKLYRQVARYLQSGMVFTTGNPQEQYQCEQDFLRLLKSAEQVGHGLGTEIKAAGANRYAPRYFAQIQSAVLGPGVNWSEEQYHHAMESLLKNGFLELLSATRKRGQRLKESSRWLYL